jgi:molybdopterin-dependent oxidoreductase alpha subunit
VAMKQTLGVAASTVSYKDWIGTDLLVFFGSNTPNNQPVTTKYLYYAKQQGTRIAVINPYREPGLERYWIPSVTESALFGTKLADEFFQVHTGGDRAFIAGVLKHLIEQGWTNEAFIAQHTNGFADLKEKLRAYDWALLEVASGSTHAEMLRFARLVAEARNAIFVWSMGITQHQDGVANVRAIIDLALSRGFIGKPHSGLVPIRGHSGVQGGAEVGCVPNQFAMGVAADEVGAARMRDLWGFDVPVEKGLNAVQMIDAAHAGELDWFYQSGGNFLETLPEPDYVRAAVERVPTRVHQDIVLSPQMLLEPRDWVLLLPARTRYEQTDGGTETTTERRILFSPEIAGRRIGEARNEWEIPMLIAESAKPEQRHLIHFADGQTIRAEIARVVPAYAGIEQLQKTGDQVQWGGARLCETLDEQGNSQPHFATADGCAQFSVIEVATTNANGKLRLSTRRGKQFNSMVQRERDPLNGARRDDVLLSAVDAERLGLRDGEAIVLRNEIGELRGRCRIAPIAPGNVQVHWPEGNVLLRRGTCDPECGIPDYNAMIKLERVDSEASL